jgi:hypothetical protein
VDAKYNEADVNEGKKIFYYLFPLNTELYSHFLNIFQVILVEIQVNGKDTLKDLKLYQMQHRDMPDHLHIPR